MKIEVKLHQGKPKVRKYPVLVKNVNSGAVYFMVTPSLGLIVEPPADDPLREGLYNVTPFWPDGTLTQEWRVIPPGSQVTFTQEESD